MNPPDDAPETEPHVEEHHPEEKSAVTLPTSVLALGFIAIALVGVLIATAIRSRPAEPAGANAGDDPALREAKAKIQMLQSSVNQERAKLGLSPLYGETTESAEAVAARITDDAATLVAMAKGVKDLIIQKDAELAQRSKELTDAIKLQGVLRDQAAKLEEKLSRALIDGSDAASLRSQLEAANKRIIELGDEVQRLREGPADLQARLMEVTSDRDLLRARLAELEAKLSQASLFAGTEDEMFKEALELFRGLRALENKPDSEVATAYSQFGVKLGANVLDKIDFPTGSAEVPPDDLAKIEAFAGDAPDHALLIVIGYASETGNVDTNRVLSSDRATAVARILDNAKRPGQRVQAAYLGQTDRFGSKFPERNQICEVWQIVPKN
ncbi:OmpA family protein [Luteolibacter marinus]|uniref:OmpA family protein n=1 Tax=Luteolibacter marinus TaxID=2776705 RepID=UPI001867D396|nr:OmpA family protein [Luteolibacter marinus]